MPCGILFLFILFILLLLLLSSQGWKTLNVAWKARESKWMGEKSTWKMLLHRWLWQHHLHISLSRINNSVDNLYFFRFSLSRFPHFSFYRKLAFNLTWQRFPNCICCLFTLLNKSTICWPTSTKFQLICKW